VGGSIRTVRESGYLYELGPNTLARRDAALWKLIGELGLEGEVHYAAPESRNRYIVRGGRLLALPQGPGEFLRTPLLSWFGKLRLLGDLAQLRGADPDESVAAFMRRRLGREAMEYVVDPFVRGIYAGDPERLLIRTAFPILYGWEREAGSLLVGALRAYRRQAARRSGEVPPPSPLYGFRDGLSVLPERLAEALSGRIYLRTRLERFFPLPEGGFEAFLIREGQAERVCTRYLVLAVPSFEAASLVRFLDGETARRLEEIEYAPLAVVYTAFRQEDVPRALDGFGFLCPSREGRFVLGSLWSSTLFPGRTPAGQLALTAMVGGATRPERAFLSDAALLDGVLRDYRELLGINAQPVFVRIHRWERAIPQYTGRHAEALEAIERMERTFPGLYLLGSYRQGVSVGACVAQGLNLARRLLDASRQEHAAPVGG
jgi:oxygen-dependent protoporphyrinogen oxidase